MSQFTVNVQKLGCLENENLEKNPADIENWENEDPADIED